MKPTISPLKDNKFCQWTNEVIHSIIRIVNEINLTNNMKQSNERGIGYGLQKDS